MENEIEVKVIPPKRMSILNNIVREVDAIRGYLLDPVDGHGEFIKDEIRHIEELCIILKADFGFAPVPEEDPEGEDEEEELEPEDNEEDPEEGEHY